MNKIHRSSRSGEFCKGKEFSSGPFIWFRAYLKIDGKVSEYRLYIKTINQNKLVSEQPAWQLEVFEQAKLILGKKLFMWSFSSRNAIFSCKTEADYRKCLAWAKEAFIIARLSHEPSE